MNQQHLTIGGIPAIRFGEPADRVYLYVHGKSGCKEEAGDFAEIVCDRGFQVVSFDLPRHGERKDSETKPVPWEAVPELQSILPYLKQRWQSISLYANSLGAYFSLLAFSEEQFANCLFVSLILDMAALIDKMIVWASVDARQLQAEKEIPTSFGETLSWEYYTYAGKHPIQVWNSPTAILYAGQDNMTDRHTVTDFAAVFGCRLTVYKEGEHWFHTEKQLAVLRDWIRKNYRLP